VVSARLYFDFSNSSRTVTEGTTVVMFSKEYEEWEKPYILPVDPIELRYRPSLPEQRRPQVTGEMLYQTRLQRSSTISDEIPIAPSPMNACGPPSSDTPPQPPDLVSPSTAAYTSPPSQLAVTLPADGYHQLTCDPWALALLTQHSLWPVPRVRLVRVLSIRSAFVPLTSPR